MSDQHVVTSSQSWFSRLGNALKGILVGFVLLAGGIGLLFWGEGRAVKRAKTLDEGSGVVTTVPATQVDSRQEGGLVHVTGEATTTDTLVDDDFGVSETGAIRLVRNVEMFAWIEESRTEEKKKLGGGTERQTVYSYRQDWTTSPASSSSFQVSEGHENPSMAFSSASWGAGTVTLGSFTLGAALTGQISHEVDRAVTDDDLARVPATSNAELRVDSGAFYRGPDPASPQVGDLRIRYRKVEPAVVSVVASQSGSTLESYQTKVGGTIALLEYGQKTSEEMFQAAHSANTTLAWILRGVGLLLIFFGYAMILKPLSVIADVVPFIGTLVGYGAGLLAFALAVPTALITVAIGWLAYRPLLGGTLLVTAGVLGAWLFMRARSKATQRAATAAPLGAPTTVPPPPPPPPPATP